MTLSRGAIRDAYPGITLLGSLTAPIKDLRPDTLSGRGGHAVSVSVAIRCGLTRNVPICHIHPRKLVFMGATVVLDGESFKSLICSVARIFFQFSRRSFGEFPPQYRSSANLMTIPSSNTQYATHQFFQCGFRPRHPHC